MFKNCTRNDIIAKNPFSFRMVLSTKKVTHSKRTRIVILLVSFILCVTALVLTIINHFIQFFHERTTLEWIILSIFITLTIFLSIFSVMEVKEYINHFRNLRDVGYHNHRLTYEQVIDNEYRKRIIENVIENPGVHYNQLRKNCELHPGQFRWHIDVLVEYGVIRKDMRGNHVMFFTIDTDSKEIDVLLKFPLRESIYTIIKKNPGMIASEIARRLNIPSHRNKVKYHVDKLISANFITVVQKGRKRELYPSRSS